MESTPNQTLSVCMIVKNEAHHIAEALDNFRRFADEIVVVDTGSTDNTKELARRYTESIFDFPWCDDFSAARNHSLARATSGYVLWMDADDRVAPEMATRIVQLKTAFDGKNAFYFILEDMEANGPSCSFYQLRCVPRRDDVRFVGRIHEQLKIDGLFPLTVDIVVRHEGYLHKEVHRGKLERNLALLHRERQDGRDDTFIHYYLSLTSESLGRYEEAIEHMQHALISVQRQIRESTGPYSKQMNMSAMMDVHYHLARFFRRANRREDAMRHITMAQTLGGDDSRTQYNLGLLYQKLNEPRRAIHCFRQAMDGTMVKSLFPAAPLPSREKLLIHIAFCHLRLREPETAMAHLRQAREASSRPDEIWELLGFYALNASEWAISLQAYESAFESGAISGVGCYFLGSLYQQRNQIGKAITTFQRGVEKDPSHTGNKLALAKILLRSGQREKASSLIDSLLKAGIARTEIFSPLQA